MKKMLRDSHVYLAKTEEKYKQMCQLHLESSVHWLKKKKTKETPLAANAKKFTNSV
jgi:hypothetical protein